MKTSYTLFFHPVMYLLFIGISTNTCSGVSYDDGKVHNIDFVIDDLVTVWDSDLGEYTTMNLLDGSDINGSFKAYDNSIVNMFGGKIRSSLVSLNDSHVEIFYGVIDGNIQAVGSSSIEIRGGAFNDIMDVEESSQIIVYGSDFSFDGVGVDYGTYTYTGGIYYTTYNLTGTLKNGDLVDNEIHVWANASLVLIPEPATMGLFTAIFIVILRKKKCNQ